MRIIWLLKKIFLLAVVTICFVKLSLAEPRVINDILHESISEKPDQVTNSRSLSSKKSQLHKEAWIDYGPSIPDAIKSIGSTAATLRVSPGTYAIAADLAIPSNINLKPEPGVIFTIASGATLTLNCSFEAGPHQIFSLKGTGRVFFGGLIKEIYPEWFNNNLTQTFACASPYSRIIFLGRIYTTDSIILTANNVTLYTPCGATISQNVSGAANAVLSIASDYVTVDGLNITGQIQPGQEADEAKACIFITGEGVVTRKGVTIKNCRLSGKQSGIFTENSNGSFYLSDATIENNHIQALHWGIMGGNWSANLPVNNNIRILNNDVATVTAGGYPNFVQARAIQFINTNNLMIRGNKAIGGFGSIENYCGQTLGAIEAAVINHGGSGYAQGDLLTVVQKGGDRGTIRVTAVDGKGTITGIDLIPSGKGYSIANDVATAGGAGTGATINITNTGRPYQHNVQIVDNITDGHITFGQVFNGSCANNIVDLTLRDPSWPKFDDPAVVKVWGYMPGIEAAALDNCTVTGNSIRNQVAAGITQGTGKYRSTVISNNTIKNIGDPARSPQNYACGIYLDGPNEEVTISGNIIEDCAMGGIQQISSTGYPYIKQMVICNNNIRNTGQHGIFISNADGLNINGNIISMPKPAAMDYDGMNFDGKNTIIKNANISGNTIIGGRYGIYQPYTDASITRALMFSNNIVSGTTSKGYLIYGRKQHNQSAGVVCITADSPPGHIPTNHGFDSFTLDQGAPVKITHIDGGTLGNTITINFARADTMLINDNNYLRLAGGRHVTPTAGSVMTFMCVADIDPANNIWIEVSRSIN